MRTAYLNTLYDLAQQDSNVYALISDNGAIVYDKYREDLGAQYLNLGISEANMLGVAAGMASCGKIPFAYTIGAFLAYRALEFIRNDICLQNQNVKVVGTGAGMIYSALGPTHHSTEDLGCLRSLPNLTILSPASPMEVEKATRAAYHHAGPVYLRLGTNREQEIYESDYDFVIGKGVTLAEGTDITIVGTGNILTEVMKSRKALEDQGISVRVINIHTIKPFDADLIRRAIAETRAIVTVEDHNVIGGLGSAVAEVIAESGQGIPFHRVGLKEAFAKGYGTYEEMKAANQMNLDTIAAECKKLLAVQPIQEKNSGYWGGGIFSENPVERNGKEWELWDKYGKTQQGNSVRLGPYTSYQFRESRRHLLFTVARYKFAMKMLASAEAILDLGCNDGFGTYYLGENGGSVTGVDFDRDAIQFAQNEPSLHSIRFIQDDFLGKQYGEFDGVTSFDVIEHIYPENMPVYMETVLKNLKQNGIFIVGTPSLESQVYSKENVSGAHVNVYKGEELQKYLSKYFNNVFMYTQNDEIIHTGHFRMANYLLAVCCNKKDVIHDS